MFLFPYFLQVDYDGSETYTLSVKNIVTGEILSDVVKDISGEVEKGVFYTCVFLGTLLSTHNLFFIFHFSFFSTLFHSYFYLFIALSVFDILQIEWGADSTTLFYLKMDDEHRPNQLYMHVLGTDQDVRAHTYASSLILLHKLIVKIHFFLHVFFIFQSTT